VSAQKRAGDLQVGDLAVPEPPCPRECAWDAITGTVSWPFSVLRIEGEPHASVVACDLPEHQELASRWVESVTGRRGVYQPIMTGGRRG
jgi:hypothetical protein